MASGETVDRTWREALWPDPQERRRLLACAEAAIGDHMDWLATRSAAPSLDAAQIRARLARFDFSEAIDLDAVVSAMAGLLDHGIVQVGHPRYFGLFNPTPAFPGLVADMMTAAWNPQLAVWSHAAAAVEAEAHVLRHVAQALGLSHDEGAAHFTSGGSEANATALLVALTRQFPGFAQHGATALPPGPRLYASAESHLAWLKILHQSGLGRSALRLIAVDRAGRLDPAALQDMIARDTESGATPVMICATAGTTNAGALDPLFATREIARRYGVHFHVDAAWAGAAAFSPKLRTALAGIADADSVTVDAHKWFSLPMGAGMFFCRRLDWLSQSFRVSTDYMPDASDGIDPYTHSQQWSRRFIGLKLFLTLAALGDKGLAAQLEHQAAMGAQLKTRLAGAGWQVINDTPLPVACFIDPDGGDPAGIAAQVVARGRAWISTTRLAGRSCIRACVTSFLSEEPDLAILTEELRLARGH